MPCQSSIDIRWKMIQFYDFNETKRITQLGLEQTEEDRSCLTNKGLPAMSIFSIFTAPPAPQLQTPKWKHSYLNYPIRTKEPLYKKGGQKREEKSIPIMLVQALQYQNTACERGTAGRGTKSIAPGLWFCVVSRRGVEFSTTYSLLETRQSASVQLSVR